jgi:hypothetical protein
VTISVPTGGSYVWSPEWFSLADLWWWTTWRDHGTGVWFEVDA